MGEGTEHPIVLNNQSRGESKKTSAGERDFWQ